MRKALLQLHGAVLLAGFTGILGRLITLNEGLLVWYRLLFTAVTLWLLFFLQKKLQRIPFQQIMKITGVGAIAALHWVTFYGSIKYANVSVALVTFSAIGFFTALLEPIVLRKPINWTELLLGLIAILGISLIFHFDPQYKTGIVIGLISSLLGALFPILNRQLLQQHTPETVTLYELSGGFLFLSCLIPFYLQAFPADHILPTWSDLGWLLVLAWFCTVLAFMLSMNALRRLSAFTFNLTYNLEPLYGIALAFVVYREDKLLKGSFYIGLSFIVLSVLLQTWLVYRAHKKSKLSVA
ncbi:DMT family transporter [Paraflavitalea sp. CAU 1676]|uniref:DMT family transporter n=1 Tax=Paraflavitalea sp. CAU 1676 TaxID=3032598 RepID=UPI0023DC3650|nr:DMT family transporter [Paraflavitalea sp. CAU 1676]MDF2191775.1 DMT family transporter [Paraflavitalea sp. CAU 1676]